KKCLGKMGQVSRTGRAVLFVSHQMAAIESLCDRCLLFEDGRLICEGETRKVLDRYQITDQNPATGSRNLMTHLGRTSWSVPTMRELSLASNAEEPIAALCMGAPLEIKVKFTSSVGPLRPVLGVVLKTRVGLSLFGINNRLLPNYHFDQPVQTGTIRCRFEYL